MSASMWICLSSGIEVIEIVSVCSDIIDGEDCSSEDVLILLPSNFTFVPASAMDALRNL